MMELTMISKKNLRAVVGILGASCILSLVACSADTPVTEAQTSQTATSLAALGVMETSPDADGYQLFGDAHRPLGHVVVRGPNSYIVELVDDVVEASWNEQRMNLACNGAAVTLNMDSSNRWAHQSGGSQAPTSGCVRALEVGRILTQAAGVEAQVVTPKLQGETCSTRSTWVWGTGNCVACLNSPGMHGGSTTCSDGYLSTSCTVTHCSSAFEESLQ
jgi:hypothetical protein